MPLTPQKIGRHAGKQTSQVPAQIAQPEHVPAPVDWLGLMHDQLLAQSAVDRLTSTCHELIIEGPSYRQRQKPSINGRPAGVPVDDQKGHQP